MSVHLLVRAGLKGQFGDWVKRFDTYTLWVFNAQPELSHRAPGCGRL